MAAKIEEKRLGVADITDGASLANYLSQRESELAAANTAVKAAGTDLEAVKVVQAAMEAKSTALIEEMKTIRTLVKDKWRETEPDK